MYALPVHVFQYFYMGSAHLVLVRVTCVCSASKMCILISTLGKKVLTHVIEKLKLNTFVSILKTL